MKIKCKFPISIHLLGGGKQFNFDLNKEERVYTIRTDPWKYNMLPRFIYPNSKTNNNVYFCMFSVTNSFDVHNDAENSN